MAGWYFFQLAIKTKYGIHWHGGHRGFSGKSTICVSRWWGGNDKWWNNNFIVDSEQPREDVSFYRKFDLNNSNHYHKFPNQTIDPRIAMYKNDELYFDEEDQQPELCGPENRDSAESDKFSGFEKSVKK